MGHDKDGFMFLTDGFEPSELYHDISNRLNILFTIHLSPPCLSFAVLMEAIRIRLISRQSFSIEDAMFLSR